MYIPSVVEVPGGMQMFNPEADPPPGELVNIPQQAPSVLHCYWLVQIPRSICHEVFVIDIPPAVPVEVDIPPGIPSA